MSFYVSKTNGWNQGKVSFLNYIINPVDFKEPCKHCNQQYVNIFNAPMLSLLDNKIDAVK